MTAGDDTKKSVSGEKTIGGHEVSLYNDDQFAAVRKAHKIPDDFLSDFKFSNLKHAGGKGGNPIAFTKKGFIVKNLKEGDHQCLIELTERLCSRASQNESFISPFYLHFKDLQSGRNFAVMPNAFWRISIGKIFWKFKMDLKGCQDDRMIQSDNEDTPEVHKRFWMCWNCWYCCDYCCYDCDSCGCLERRKYKLGKVEAYLGKLQLTQKQKIKFARTLQSDAEFLKKCGTMDYSLLVGVEAYSSPEDAKDAGEYTCCIRDETTGDKVYLVYHFGIVDIFQKWTCAKVIARTIKLSCPCFAPRSSMFPSKFRGFNISDVNSQPLPFPNKGLSRQFNPSPTRTASRSI